jgi:membrane-bound serine protease (ClpP class)
VRMDTPGGLDTSMRAIVKDLIASPVPVAVYVSPNGARAASAGLFVTEGADVAAMAPQTNIGSATPISIGPGPQDEVLGRKIRNDAAAYVRALAEGHGRNPDLAERMVRDAVNVTAVAALRQHLVDLVAPTEPDLLRRLDGFRVRGPKAGTLHTAGLVLVHRDMTFPYEVRQVLVDPTVAFLLLLAGLLGVGFELFHPGAVAPGAFGAVALLLGLYGSAQLPVTAVGVLLLAAGAALFFAEAHITSHGALGIAGILALVAGGLLLFDTDSDVFKVSVPAAAAAGALLGGFTLFVISKAVGARRGPVRTGWEELVGLTGTVRVAPAPLGQVYVQGALWRARAADGDGAPLSVGDRVRVESVDGLTLTVRRSDRPGEREEGSTQ